jgi:hypothetical protein
MLQGWEDCISLSSDGGPPGAQACTFFPVASESLVADDRSEVGIAYNDSSPASAADFSAGVKINGGAGATTDATHTITLTADPGNRHYGIAGAGVWVNNLAANPAVWILDDYVSVEWLELTGAQIGIYAEQISAGSGSVGASRLVFRNNLIHTTAHGISLSDGNVVSDVYNNITYDQGAGSVGIRVTPVTPLRGPRSASSTIRCTTTEAARSTPR